MSIERYTAASVDDYAEMMTDSAGQWVSYRDHEEIVNKLEFDNAITINKLERALHEYKSICSQLTEELKEAGLYE
jgi:hypothetical protein